MVAAFLLCSRTLLALLISFILASAFFEKIPEGYVHDGKVFDVAGALRRQKHGKNRTGSIHGQSAVM
jgi:hypothetical protein